MGSAWTPPAATEEALARAARLAVGDRVRDPDGNFPDDVGTVTGRGRGAQVTWDHGGSSGHGAVAAGYLEPTGMRVPVEALPEIEAARAEWRRRHHAGEPCTDDDVGVVARRWERPAGEVSRG